MMKFRRAHEPLNPLEDGQAFVRFYEHHAESLLVFFTRRVYQPEVALDLTAETFAQAFRSRKRFRGHLEAEAAAWLYAIARHLLAAYLRRGKAERKALDKLGIDVPELSQDEYKRVEELADLSGLRAGVAAGLARISPDHRQALELRIVNELPYAEVARRLGVSETTARARVSRGLRALAKALDLHLKPEESMP
jgi:RNA polymerase sigma factor (sigma-70 family)